MFFIKIKKILTIFLLSLFIIPINALAYSEYLIPGGENIGIELKSNGIIVVGVYKVNGVYPANEAGISVGDIITAVDEVPVTSINDMVTKINDLRNESVTITYMRSNVSRNTNLKLYKDNTNVYKTGLYVKDGITGIGTLTFIDPNTKLFGALGHEIIEKTTGKKLEIKDGKIYSSVVTGIEPSVNGAPGEKNARYDNTKPEGNVFENTEHGIFGNYKEVLPQKQMYKVADFSDIKKGEAKIFTVLDGEEVKEYAINILKVTNSPNQTTKNLLFEIIDPELLKRTGGIVQGMSGSPIVQGDFIIGAVTHVVVDNPTRGYGILIINMLEEAEN